LKQRNPKLRVVAVEPAGAALLSGGRPGEHRQPGIGVGFLPAVLNRSVVDEVIAVTDEDAFDVARRLAREEGILAGVSSGTSVQAALELASRDELAGKTVVVLLPDTGERYVTTPLFARD
jgi:cysteine synthase A